MASSSFSMYFSQTLGRDFILCSNISSSFFFLSIFFLLVIFFTSGRSNKLMVFPGSSSKNFPGLFLASFRMIGLKFRCGVDDLFEASIKAGWVSAGFLVF
jgi:hypothetical protein